MRATVSRCGELGVGYLTLFAFSSENWSRPQDEVVGLMKLFLDALQREVAELHENNVRLRFIGDLSRLSDRLRRGMEDAERLTAARRLAEQAATGALDPATIDEQRLTDAMSLAGCPDPDLMIRTGGEQRISNFLLWHAAYAELYFSDVLWPDFDAEALEQSFAWFTGRDRRFGRVETLPKEEAG